jgi:hypothetical protein
VACALFIGSACGVAVIVTLFGEGAAKGAVYVAVFVIVPEAPVVAAPGTSVPQAAPLHPAPHNAHVTTPLGCEPGTGVSVAVIATLAPVETLEGADN